MVRAGMMIDPRLEEVRRHGKVVGERIVDFVVVEEKGCTLDKVRVRVQVAVGHSCCYYNAKGIPISVAPTIVLLDHAADPSTAVVAFGEAEAHCQPKTRRP